MTFHFDRSGLGRGLAACAAGVLISALPLLAQAQAPIRLLVGYNAGGPVDTAARTIAPVLGKELGANVIVENRPGANATIAGSAVVNAAPDGTTLFFAASPTITISPNVMRKMAFDPAKDLAPIAPVLSYDNVLVVNKETPYKTIQDLIAAARAKPGSLTYGSAGIGGSNHLSGELFAVQAGIKLNHIPYKGNAPAMTDVIGGQLTMMFDIVANAIPHISSGRVRAVAVTSGERNASLPDVPTMRESGLPDFEVTGWFGLYGPKTMPADMIARFNKAMQQALSQPELAATLKERGYDLWIGEPALLVERAAQERAMWATVTKDITVD
ncbi:MAG TPA: tripartite tricarboxylate transporter substrate binding protein [Burkholderiaceae bacterium]|nr:tripartite tricarboxylate transporter substrate binding protein [Burkholderiaceae bacterium]